MNTCLYFVLIHFLYRMREEDHPDWSDDLAFGRILYNNAIASINAELNKKQLPPTMLHTLQKYETFLEKFKSYSQPVESTFVPSPLLDDDYDQETISTHFINDSETGINMLIIGSYYNKQ